MQDHLRPVPDTASPPAEPPADKQRAASRSRPARPLPTDRMKIAGQLNALRAYAIESHGGQHPVTTEAVANRISILPNTTGLTNGFFLEAGFLIRKGKGLYAPTEAALEFERRFGFDQADAGRALADPLRESWYFTEVKQQCAMGPTIVDDLIRVLARAAGTGAERRAQLMLVLDWLVYAGLIEVEGQSVKIAAGAPAEVGEEVTTENPGGVPKLPADPQVQKSTKGTGERQHPQGPPVLSLAFDFKLSAEDLGALSPEQIRAVFEAVGAVAAIKATLLT